VAKVFELVLVDEVTIKNLHGVLDSHGNVLARMVKLSAIHALALPGNEQPGNELMLSEGLEQ